MFSGAEAPEPVPMIFILLNEPMIMTPLDLDPEIVTPFELAPSISTPLDMED